jgi:hypothetical protein
LRIDVSGIGGRELDENDRHALRLRYNAKRPAQNRAASASPELGWVFGNAFRTG